MSSTPDLKENTKPDGMDLRALSPAELENWIMKLGEPKMASTPDFSLDVLCQTGGMFCIHDESAGVTSENPRRTRTHETSANTADLHSKRPDSEGTSGSSLWQDCGVGPDSKP